VPAATTNVTILNGHTYTLPNSGTRTCANLTVESTGKLYGNAAPASSPNYLNISGDILCNGSIGNGSTADAISFNVEGAYVGESTPAFIEFFKPGTTPDHNNTV
jgi:hypothetical protein